MTMVPDLYSCDLAVVDAAQLREFVAVAIETRAQAESVVLEFKAKRDKGNLVEAVAALSNTDGGLVLVGVDEKAADPVQGVKASEVDSVVQSLRQLTPDAMPEVVPIALPDRPDRVVIVLRVDADQVEPPVVVHGRVLVRVPGQTVGATREQIRSLFSRPLAEAPQLSFVVPADPVGVSMWDDNANVGLEIRAAATVTLPHRARSRRWIGSGAIESLRVSLEASPAVTGALASHARANERRPVGWTLTEKSAIRYRLRSDVRESAYRGSPSLQMSMLVTFAGRSLQVLVAARLSPRDASGPLALLNQAQDLREALLATAWVAASGCNTISDAMGVGAPVATRVLEGAVMGKASLAALKLPAHWDAPPVDPQGPRRLARTDVETFDAGDVISVVDAWLIETLLDLGATGFEAEVDNYRPPTWFPASE